MIWGEGAPPKRREKKRKKNFRQGQRDQGVAKRGPKKPMEPQAPAPRNTLGEGTYAQAHHRRERVPARACCPASSGTASLIWDLI